MSAYYIHPSMDEATIWFDAIDVNTYPGFLQTYLWFISKYPLL